MKQGPTSSVFRCKYAINSMTTSIRDICIEKFERLKMMVDELGGENGIMSFNSNVFISRLTNARVEELQKFQ